MTYLILGCGWVGEALAQQLLVEGHRVYATTTGSEKYQRLQSAGIFAIQTDFDVAITAEDFPTAVDFVLTSVPAVKRLDQQHIQARFDRVQLLLSQLTYKKHIFLSSIGVYPDQDGLFTEAYRATESDILSLAEDKMLACTNSIVLRLGGLFGGTRIFAKYFADKICTTGGQLANFVHQADVIALIKRVFYADVQSSVYNVVAPEHPLKKEVVLTAAAKYGYPLPSSFEDKDSFQKFVSGSKLQSELQYSFIYPSPLDF